MITKGSGRGHIRWLIAAATVVAGVGATAGAAVADHQGIAHPPGDPTSAYELVSPPYKVSGAGVGSPPTSTTHRVQHQAAGAGIPAYVGERFAVGGDLGATMLDSPFATANDWALAERVSDQLGWQSHSPVPGPFRCSEDYRMQQLQQASPDFSTLIWIGNAGDLPFFEEMCEMGAHNNGSSLVSDWGNPPATPNKWEPIGPLAAAQAFPSILGTGMYFQAPAVSADGSRLAMSGPVRGLAGAGGLGCTRGTGVWVEIATGDPCPDPTVDTIGETFGNTPHSAYIDDISAGLSGSWPGAGVRIPAAACTGAGAARTEIPARDDNGTPADSTDDTVAAGACPPREPNRDSRLVSAYGSSITWQSEQGSQVGTSNANVISVDGSRTFFMAPDPATGPSACRADTGPGTRCPAQLYVRQRNADGRVVTRWVSRPDADRLAAGFPASLLGPTYFEGASADGSVVFFRTDSPLTVDDPNGEFQPAPDTNADPETVRSPTSWDLYMFELAPGPDPTGPGSELTRITGGPDGDSDCSTQPTSRNAAALRFSSQDGDRVYFACAAPLSAGPGVLPDRDPGLLPGGVQGGAPSMADQTNIYLYDATADRYTFVARIPSSDRSDPTRCASTAALRGQAMHSAGFYRVNCWRGTDDGAFATFWTGGRLTDDDPVGAESFDIYGYDAAVDELVRVSAAQGPPEEAYVCAGVACHADQGLAEGRSHIVANPLLSVVTDPAVSGRRTVYFESASRLVAGDENDVFDVYRWRDGVLSLVSSGAPDSRGAAYKGNSADGRNVYLMTADRLTWQDIDEVADVYTARVGGGIPEPPPPPPPCAVLAGACHGGGVTALAVAPQTGRPGGGDASPAARKRLAVGRPGRRARRRAARSGVVRVRVRVSEAGRVAVIARARVGKRVRRVGRTSRRLARPGAVVVRVRLSRRARAQLRRGRGLRVAIVARSPGAIPDSVRVTLRRAGK